MVHLEFRNTCICFSSRWLSGPDKHGIIMPLSQLGVGLIGRR
jgi:hypothetical protein